LRSKSSAAAGLLPPGHGSVPVALPTLAGLRSSVCRRRRRVPASRHPSVYHVEGETSAATANLECGCVPPLSGRRFAKRRQKAISCRCGAFWQKRFHETALPKRRCPERRPIFFTASTRATGIGGWTVSPEAEANQPQDRSRLVAAPFRSLRRRLPDSEVRFAGEDRGCPHHGTHPFTT
jgi:hypothetical protein